MSLELHRNNSKPIRRGHGMALLLPGTVTAVLCGLTGCNGLPGTTGSSSAVTTKPGPRTYMAPAVTGAPGGGGVTEVLQSYKIDDTPMDVTTGTGMSFEQSTYSARQGAQVILNNSGTFTVLQRNLRSLTTTYSNPTGAAGGAVNQTGGWAVELAGQAGGLIQLPGQPFTPLVAATACPSGATPETYQFVTIPSPLLNPSPAGQTVNLMYNPAVETGYGSVSISGSGNAVTLNSITQHTLPNVKGSTGTPTSPSPASATGTCSSTLYGETISVPGQVIITNPGNGETIPASATIGIGPTGLLVEDNGGNTNLAYQNALGAGTGAIGLPQPKSALGAAGTSAVVGAQYLGFTYNSGLQPVSSGSSSLASFGFPSVPASCAALAAPTATLIYGGDFNNNDASGASVQSAGGFGTNCDYAIDLGIEDSANNGLYLNATVYVGGGDVPGTPHSFMAVAIVGQLAGKYAIFVLGIDTTGTPNQARGIYLLQSN